MSLETKKTEAAQTRNSPFAKMGIPGHTGRITACIWKNTTEKGSFYTVTFERRYRDSEGNWKSSHSYSVEDLLPLAKAMDMIHTKLVELKNNDLRNNERK